MPGSLNLVALCGSLRRDSLNSMLLDTVIGMLPPQLAIRRLEFRHLPVYDGDLEVDELPPADVRELQRAIRASDGLVICTPEYNHGVPGGLKNAIDWLSRGPAPHGLYEVPSALLGASDGMIGTTRAQYHLRQTLAALNSPAMPFPQVLVSVAHTKFDAERRLTHEPTRGFLGTWIHELERWMRRFPRAERSAA